MSHILSESFGNKLYANTSGNEDSEMTNVGSGNGESSSNQGATGNGNAGSAGNNPGCSNNNQGSISGDEGSTSSDDGSTSDVPETINDSNRHFYERYPNVVGFTEAQRIAMQMSIDEITDDTDDEDFRSCEHKRSEGEVDPDCANGHAAMLREDEHINHRDNRCHACGLLGSTSRCSRCGCLFHEKCE